MQKVHPYKIPLSIRIVSYNDLKFNKEDVLGIGTYGKCIRGKLLDFDVCIKVIRKGKDYQSTFFTETTLLSHCCHPNLPWIYAVVHKPSIIISSLYIINDCSHTIHSILNGSTALKLLADEWKKVIYGVILAIDYLHTKSIIHNDIKGNNVVIHRVNSEAKSVLIDLGKGCFLEHGRTYNISNEKKREYKKKYPHIAPDLVDGHCNQTKKSDLFSFGKIIMQINDAHLKLPALTSIYLHCNEYYCSQRPSTSDIKTTIHNLFYL